MTSEFRTLRDAAANRRAALLDFYGATNPAEFFAVATECFFEKSVRMRDRHPSLYAALRDYYHQDPADAQRPGASAP
jgi:Mlc titration factor MtfA (ptsG expression regulator)